MMERLKFLLEGFLVVFLLLFVSCSSPSLVGIVHVAGYEPHTWVEIGGFDGGTYRIYSSEAIDKKLRALRGKKVIVEYSKLYSAWGDETINVLSVTEVER